MTVGERPGRVVVLSGGSSAGKTTLARKLQASFSGHWVLVGFDLFMWMLPPEMVSDPAGLMVHDGVVTRGDSFRSLYVGFQGAVAALARGGFDVLLDDVMLDGAADQRAWSDALYGVDTVWIGVRCAPEIASAREAERGDRPCGIARRQAISVHEGVRYDLEVDTGVLGLAEAVDLIAGFVGRMRSMRVTPASDDAPTHPSTSAWTRHGGVRPPPWEG